jgi:hypothetical protein
MKMQTSGAMRREIAKLYPRHVWTAPSRQELSWCFGR